MPARLGEGVIAMLPRSPRLTITPAPGAARGLAKAVEGATLALAKFGAAVGQVLAASMARTPARKPGVALLPGRRTAKKFGGVPIVRIHFPPPASRVRTLVFCIGGNRSRRLRVKHCRGDQRAVAGSAGGDCLRYGRGRSARGRRRGDDIDERLAIQTAAIARRRSRLSKGGLSRLMLPGVSSQIACGSWLFASRCRRDKAGPSSNNPGFASP